MSKEFFQKIANIQKNLKSPKNLNNSFGNYAYRSCEGILESVKPLLDGLVLSITDDVIAVGDRIYVKATATLTDGEHSHSVSALAREPMSKKGMDDAQVTGATSSYARKYCLNGMFAIDDSKDADSNEHKQQENNFNPDLVLGEFTDSAMNTKNLGSLQTEFRKAWKLLEKTPEQAKAKEVYDIRKSELEAA
ncbi:ERF family protein [Providencia heimbachae]|uniref:ERF family protein n=1 Tax=Providencia heimbachae TaxID=333962 RepID=UPI00223F3969|nr:ERF family protein [Providencia heimbachae]